MTRRIDWAGLMRAGMHGLRLSPEAFWRMTPVELMLMMGLGSGTAPMRRGRFEDLLRAFPDGPGEGGGDGGVR